MPGVIDTDDRIAALVRAVANRLDVIAALLEARHLLGVRFIPVALNGTHQHTMIRLTAERHIIPAVPYHLEAFLVPVASIIIPIAKWVVVLLRGLLAVVGELIRMGFEPFCGFFFSLVEDFLFLLEELDFCGNVPFL